MGYDKWREDESEFLTNLALEPPSDAIAVAYIEELEKLQCAELVTCFTTTELNYMLIILLE
jgi:hypothetical protein